MKIEWFGLDGLEQTRRDNVTVLATVGAAGALLHQLPNSAHRVSTVPGTSGLPGERVTVDPDNVADGTTVTYPSANGVELLFGLQGQSR